jgi:signal transduction histidine kinase
MKRASPKPIPRLLMISALMTTAGVIIVMVVFIGSFSQNLTLRTGLVMADYLKIDDALGCQRAPEKFQIPLESGGAIFSYDAKTLLSVNKDAPTFPVSMKKSFLEGTRFPLKFNLFSGDYGYFALPLGLDGPCGIFLLKFRDFKNLRIEAWLLIVSMILMVIFLIAVIGFFLLLRPASQRVALLTRITQLMGNDDGFPDKMSSIDDEFSTIERGLHRAHERLLKDKTKLAHTASALQNHLSDVAHDLRTPIASLQLALEQLRNDNSEQEKKPWLTTALMDAVFLEGLTDNLRIEAQLREGLYVLTGGEKTDLIEVVQRVAARFNLLAQQRDMTLAHAHPDGKMWVAAHPVLAERALGNIVHNAIRHGDAVQGNVAIVLDIEEDSFSLTVLDDGPGIEEQNLQKVKDRNFRGDEARQRDHTGQGLGLSIAQAFADQSNFTIEFRPNEPRGLLVLIKGKILN